MYLPSRFCSSSSINYSLRDIHGFSEILSPVIRFFFFYFALSEIRRKRNSYQVSTERNHCLILASNPSISDSFLRQKKAFAWWLDFPSFLVLILSFFFFFFFFLFFYFFLQQPKNRRFDLHEARWPQYL